MQIGFDIISEGAAKKAAPAEEAPSTEPMRPRSADRRAPSTDEQKIRREVGRSNRASWRHGGRPGVAQGAGGLPGGSEVNARRRVRQSTAADEPADAYADALGIERDHFTSRDPIDPYLDEGTHFDRPKSTVNDPKHHQGPETGYQPFHPGPGGYDLQPHSYPEHPKDTLDPDSRDPGPQYGPHPTHIPHAASYDNVCPYCHREGCSPNCPGPSGGSQPCPSCGGTAQIHNGTMKCDSCGHGHEAGSLHDTDPESAGNRRFTGAKPDEADWDAARAARPKPLTEEQVTRLQSLYDEKGNFVGRPSTPKAGSLRALSYETPDYATSKENQMSSRTAAAGWPKVPHPHFPGETTSACPKCNSTSIEMGADWAPTGTGSGGRGRMGDPGSTEYKRCKGCGHTDRTSPRSAMHTTASRHTSADDHDECRHCERRIVNHPDDGWVDPEATGDDSVWRETCDDNHHSFRAEHEPKIKTATEPRWDRTEAALLQAMASTSDYETQRRIAVDLEVLRHQKRLAREDETSIDLGDEMVHDTLTPVLTHAHHSGATDWMAEATPGEGKGADHAVQAMVTLANRWFAQVSGAVRSDQAEFEIQARGYARVHASRHGAHAAAASDAFLRQVGFLLRRTSVDTDKAPGSGLDQVDEVEPEVMWPITDPAPGAFDPNALQPINPVPPTYADQSEEPETESPEGEDTVDPSRPKTSQGSRGARVASRGMYEAKSGTCTNYVHAVGGCGNCGGSAAEHLAESRKHAASLQTRAGYRDARDEHTKVQKFVNQDWAGLYHTQLHEEHPDSSRTWKSNLHGPDGPVVFTHVHPDGKMEDRSRKQSSRQIEAAKWSPASGMGGRAEPKDFKASHTFHPIGWDQFDARPHPGSKRIAPGSPVMNHGKMDPNGLLIHVQDEHGNHQTVDKRSLHNGRVSVQQATAAEEKEEDDLNGRRDTTPATGSEEKGADGELGSTLPNVPTLGWDGSVDQPWEMDENVPGTGASDVADLPAPGMMAGGWPQPTASRTASEGQNTYVCHWRGDFRARVQASLGAQATHKRIAVRASEIEAGHHLSNPWGAGPRITEVGPGVGGTIKIKTINGGSKIYNPHDEVEVTHHEHPLGDGVQHQFEKSQGLPGDGSSR